MDADMLWTAALTAGLGLIGWVLKSAVDEMQRLNILLNKTREEMAKDYVTKADSTAVMAQIVARFDRYQQLQLLTAVATVDHGINNSSNNVTTASDGNRRQQQY